MEQRSEAWFRVRAGRITGSRFSRAMAGKRSNDYRNLIDELVEERRRGRALDGGYVNPAMRWGMDYEDAARLWYGRSRGCTVHQIGFVVHHEYDYVGVSPDGLVDSDGLVEIKCPQMKGFRQVMESRQMPSRYRWQVQGQLWVCRREWADFVCFYPPGQGIVIRIVGIQRDFDQLEARCREVNLEVERRVGRRKLVPTNGHDHSQSTSMPVPSQPDKPPTTEPWTTPNRPRRQTKPSGLPGWMWFLLIVIAWAWLSR